MGLGFSIDGGDTWTNSLVPGYPADTSAEGMASPEYIRTNNASDPLGAFDTHGRFFFGAISYNGLAGPGTNADVWVARYNVVDPAGNGGYPLDYRGTTRVGRGTPSANFNGKFLDKPMLEVDRTGGRFDGNVYMCFTKFPAFGQSEIYFAASSDHGRSFTKPVRVSGAAAGQGCDIAVEHDGDVYVSWRDFEGNSPKKNFGVSVVRSSNAGAMWSAPKVIATLPGYNPFDGARDCGDGADACPSDFVFSRVPLEPRLTADPTGELPGVYSVVQAAVPSTDRREHVVLRIGRSTERERPGRPGSRLPDAQHRQRANVERPVPGQRLDDGSPVLPGRGCPLRPPGGAVAGQPRRPRL